MLFSVVVTIGLVTILGEAAGGKIDSRSVFELMAYSSFTNLPALLSLSIFIAVLMVMMRSWQDSEIPVWFSSGGLSLLRWIVPVLRFAMPMIILVGVISIAVTPWAKDQIERTAQQFEQRDDVLVRHGELLGVRAPARGLVLPAGRVEGLLARHHAGQDLEDLPRRLRERARDVREGEVLAVGHHVPALVRAHERRDALDDVGRAAATYAQLDAPGVLRVVGVLGGHEGEEELCGLEVLLGLQLMGETCLLRAPESLQGELVHQLADLVFGQETACCFLLLDFILAERVACQPLVVDGDEHHRP